MKLTRAGQAAARAIVLHASDFVGEPGWKGKEQKPSYDASVACGAYHPNARDLVVHGDVDVTFSRGSESIESEATVFDSPAMVRTDWRRVVTPALLPCIVKMIRAELPSGPDRGRALDDRVHDDRCRERGDSPEPGDGSPSRRLSRCPARAGDAGRGLQGFRGMTRCVMNDWSWPR